MRDLASVWSAAWDVLDAGVADGDHPARIVTLATRGRDGWPVARSMALRAADRDAPRLEIQCDAAAPKIEELGADCRATVLAWDPGSAIQVRLRVRVTIGDGPAMRDRWDAVPEPAREAYGHNPPPGSGLDGPDTWTIEPKFARFAVLLCDVASVDVVHLGEPHRRAGFDAADGFAGRWRVP